MSTVKSAGGGKHRKPGDWRTVAAGRTSKERALPTSRGLSNIPSVADTGSAAYRRLARKGNRHD